jgi:cellulose synthase operon protein C
MSDANEPKRPGVSGSAGSIGKELGGDLDFESDALLDSLLGGELPASVAPSSLHRPVKREYSEDDVTVVGRSEDLLKSLIAQHQHDDDGTSGLEELASSDVDQLLSSLPVSAAEISPIGEAPSGIPRLPDVPPAPRVPAVPRPASRLPSIQRPSLDATAKPPALNPAGLPARQPFPPALSPRAPSARESAPRFAAPRPGSSTEAPSPASLATTSPPPASPVSAAPTSAPSAPARRAAALHESEEDEEERTRIFTQSSAGIQPSDPDMLADPFVAPQQATDPRSSMPTLQQIDPASRLPTLSVPQPDAPLSMPSIPGPQSLPATGLRDSEFELFPETPEPFGADALDELSELGLNEVTGLDELSGLSDLTERRGPLDSADLSPLPIRASLPPSVWLDERPAKDHLAEQHETWVTRAEWFEHEANAASDAQAKTRLLIVASELWALVGDITRARDVAGQAAAVPRAQGMAARQMRALAAADGDFRAVAPALEMEIRGAATVDARVHAAYFSAEVHRLALQDDATAKKKLDLAVRAQQDDPRAHIAKLTDLLGKSNAPARVRIPESGVLADLLRASEELLRLRGAPAAQGSPPATGPRAAFDDARRALSSGEREKAADALERLSTVEGLGQACAWLSTSLLGAEPKLRARSSARLSELAVQGGSRLARRGLVTRALEQGDAEGVRQAIVGSQGEETFSAPDRLALAALTGLSAQSLESTVWQVAHEPELRPLAAAFVAAASNGALDVRTGSEASRAEQRLGQALGTAPSDAAGLGYLRGDADAFESTHPMSPLARLLSLEFAKAAQAKGSVAVALGEWPRSTESPEAERDQRLAAALVHELAGEHSSATVMYRRVLELDPTSEAALRALSHAAPGQTGELLIELADHLGASPRAGLALLEAALRQGSDDTGYAALLERAKVADPELSLSYRLAEVAARQSGDGAALLTALRSRREASDDSVEQALDLVREALLVAESDLPLADRLLEEALRACPGDLALRELSERMVPTEDQERANWREAAAETSEGATRARLLAEAALERGRAGDHEAAARNAYAATAAGLDQNELWRVVAERYAAAGPAAARISESLLEQARATEDPLVQRRIYERLSQIDQARGESSSVLLWQTAILEQSPGHLPALRRLEHAYIGGDRLEELEPIAVGLARVLDPQESNAHARLAARLRVRRGAWGEAREMAEISLGHDDSELWALRTLSAQARAAEDNALGLRIEQRLFELVERPLDKATLALRAAEAAARLERTSDTKRLLSAALEQVPDHLIALTTLCEVLEASEEYVAAAEALEVAAQASHVEAHQVSAWHQAAVLWLDKAANAERGRAALERAVALDIGHEDAVVRLQSLYVAANDRQKLAELLERRLECTTDPEERIAIEVTRGRALAEVGERDAAKAALAAALDANPDHAEALEAFAELCLEEGDWTSGEQALIRLARHVIELPRQAQIYRRLGELYDTALPNPERAELAYKEVLKREPEDDGTVARLVQVYDRLGDRATAVQLQTDLLARATTPDEKRQRTLALALVEEQIGGDRKRAEATFDRARKEWPYDSAVLRGLAEFQQRNGESRATQVLLDRAASDARRALGTGRFEPGFFEVLATVAELKNAGDAALVARSTLAALHGEEVAVPAAGPIAGDVRLDELLAPELVSAPLRALLRKSGGVLDAAYPVDLRGIRAAPLPVASAAFTSYVQQVATSFGIRGLEVFASPSLGPVCVPVSSGPPQLVFGQALLDSEDDAARYFLMIRSLKIVQGNAAALSRTAPIELWPVLAAFLSIFAPNWIPQGVEAKKLSDTQKRIQGAMTQRLDDDVPVLALEVIGAIGNRASLLGTALHQWGNRTALLSAGSLVASLRGVALAGGMTAGPPKDGGERVKWIVRNPEARDLATFAVGEQYAEARARLGLTR